MLDVHLERKKPAQNQNESVDEIAAHDEPEWVGQWEDSDLSRECHPLWQRESRTLSCQLS